MTGRTLGHYRVVEKLGAGGMGVVYRAHDERLDRDVALKVLPAGALADDAARARFRKEALALSQLNHPHICSVYEAGEADGQAYIAMEYVEGRPLSNHVAGEPLAVESAMRYGAQISDALAHAHERGVVHRDLKSSNVLITPQGRAKVLDFGLARRLRAGITEEATHSLETLTEDGRIAGTLPYMAPEVLQGEAADERSDLWALGVMLYEMAAGVLPFQGKTGFAITSAIMKEAPAPLDAQVPAGLRAVIQRCLAKEPGRRYQRAAEVHAALEAIQPGAAEPPPRSRPVLPRWWRLAAGALAAVLLLVAGLLSFRTPARAPIESLAVLPLENLSGDPAQEYFADGMTEELIGDLAQIRALRVISRPSVMKYKGARRPLPEIARELNVEAVVAGSVRRFGDRVRITAQLIQARTDQHLWAGSYERDVRDILALQREVAQAVAGEIRVQLRPQEQVRLARARAVQPEAYDYYLRGKIQVGRRNKTDSEAGIALLERAVALDPAFASAHAALAVAYVWHAMLFAPGQKQWEEKAAAAVEKALALDPDSAEAHFARGRLLWTPFHRFPSDQIIPECRRALELNPNLDEARWLLATTYSHLGLLEEAVQESERAAAINPGNSSNQFSLGEALLFERQYTRGLAVLDTLPSDFQSSYVATHAAWGLLHLGRRDAAQARIAAIANYPGDIPVLASAMQALLLAAAGQRRQAEEKIPIAAATSEPYGPPHHAAYYIASTYALLNRPGPAVEWLQKAADAGFPCYALFETDPHLDTLRQNPRFQALVAKLKEQADRYRTPQTSGR